MKRICTLLFTFTMLTTSSAQAQINNPVSAVVDQAAKLEQKAGDMRSSAKFQADCAAGIALDSCVKPVTPKGCPAGQHWTTMGSGIAHCVDDDPVCLAPKVLEHDYLGNPNCRTPVITTDYQYRTTSCAAPQVGTRDQRRKLTYTDGVLTSTGSWQTTSSDCSTPAPEPTPTCSNGASDYPTCTPPYTPPVVTNPTPTTPPNPGPTTGICTNGASDWPTCTPPQTCSASRTLVSSTPCGAGTTGGPINTYQTVSCPGSVVGSDTTGSCAPAVCANGASNWPICTFEPPKVECPASFKWCVQDRQMSDDPRDIWWNFGATTYEGPSCTPMDHNHGYTTTWDGGCPAGY